MFDRIVNTRDDLPRNGQPAEGDQESFDSLPKWVRILVWLILGSSF